MRDDERDRAQRPQHFLQSRALGLVWDRWFLQENAADQSNSVQEHSEIWVRFKWTRDRKRERLAQSIVANKKLAECL